VTTGTTGATLPTQSFTQTTGTTGFTLPTQSFTQTTGTTGTTGHHTTQNIVVQKSNVALNNVFIIIVCILAFILILVIIAYWLHWYKRKHNKWPCTRDKKGDTEMQSTGAWWT